MSMPSSDIAILGGGISGIIAALELEARGVFPTLYESSGRLGGRVKTDFFDDIPLDHGFQVLLTAYPEVIKYLDLSVLELNYFKPGAYIFRKDGKVELIGDAFRDPSFLWPTIKANSAGLLDKVKLLGEQRRISALSVDEIFNQIDRPTIDSLHSKYSRRFINQFFKPFYGGIFLEKQLKTTVIQFEFVFHMFAKGYAAMPKRGMQAVIDQLCEKLTKTKVLLNQKVTIEEALNRHDKVIQTFAEKDQKWHGTEVFYFELPNTSKYSDILQHVIGLFPDSNSVNSIHVLKGRNTSILSATAIGVSEDSERLEMSIREEIKMRSGIEPGKLVKHFKIEKALPVISEIRLKPDSSNADSAVIWSGDYLLYPSLNAAMSSGRNAAEKALQA
ncbi:MAG: hypothetical protein DA439_05815 [Bacteroidetes bacterium]|nr:MAG: hypothetical protein DA439_05815 [Bacteroidota bacterium]